VTEERRIVGFYRPRIQIPVETMVSDAGKWAWYCLPVDGVQALQRIAPYLRRYVTYVNEVISDKQFYGPTDAQMESIVDLVGQLEVALMSECGTEDIVTAIEANTSAILALQCICARLAENTSQGVLGDDIVTLIDNGEVIPSVTIPQETYPPQAQSDACAIAQLYYAWVYEVITETVLPALRGTFDYLVPVLAGLVGSATGGIGFIPMYLIAEFIQEIIEIGYDAAETDLINWLWAVKDDWICTAYDLLLAGATDRDIASAIAAQVIDPAVDPSYGDKVIVKAIGAAWSVQAAATAFANSTQWAQDNVTPGYCSVCTPVDPECNVFPPCIPGDWTESTPGVLGCEDGYPWVNSGWAIHETAAVTQPAADFICEIEWIAKGGPARLQFNLWSTPGDVQIAGGLSSPLAEGYTRVDSWQLNSPGTIGEILRLQLVQAAYYAKIKRYCIRPVP
jgi:hypothetical protein